jgi:hypothetical protein
MLDYVIVLLIRSHGVRDYIVSHSIHSCVITGLQCHPLDSTVIDSLCSQLVAGYHASFIRFMSLG